MPHNGVLDYSVINNGSGPGPMLGQFPARAAVADRKRKPKFSKETREFLATIFILIACIASLGICAQLCWDTYSQVQRLSQDLKLIQLEFEKELKSTCQQYEDRLNALEKKIKVKSTRQQYEDRLDILEKEIKRLERLASSDSELETEPEEAEDINYADPDYDEPPESVENTTQQDRKSAQEKLGLQPSLKWNIEPFDQLENERRRRRSAHSTNSKNEKRSLAGNKMNSECENNDCEEPEMGAKIKLAKKQEQDDRKLIADNPKSNEMTLPEPDGHENSTHESIEQISTEPVKLMKNKKDKARRKAKAQVEEEEPQVDTLRVDEPVLAAHYGGQTSKYIHTRHAQYLGNGHLYHPGGVFKDWEPSPWVRSLSMDKHFHLKDNGTLMVTKPGVYFVYAQIYYSNAHSLSSYRMYRNDESVLQCTVEMHNKPEKTRNTCFAGGLVYLDAHDQLSLKEVEGERITIFEKTKSFFGLFRVNQN